MYEFGLILRDSLILGFFPEALGVYPQVKARQRGSRSMDATASLQVQMTLRFHIRNSLNFSSRRISWGHWTFDNVIASWDHPGVVAS